jgi:large subunit ribosomal protein L29
MKISELKQKIDSELDEHLDGLLQEQFALRMQRAAGQLSRPDRIKKVRRDIARVKTLKNQRKQAG